MRSVQKDAADLGTLRSCIQIIATRQHISICQSEMEAASRRVRTLRVHLAPAASVAEEVEVAVETQAALVRCALRRKTYIIYPFHFAAAFHLGLADG